ncbi:hypothetical protein [Candidatus Magnetaquicoccus inordinatus]|uniref:hypothetical protein n=1 Tax=Candidatus Magnetaquicoccus inordinatus TaxID=2496818 RepID=UPI00102BC904|nr:hypothetical protein [Candidatus Magnetaquicoccus inordinatus]
MSKTKTAPTDQEQLLRPEKEDYDSRFEVVQPGFSEDQDLVHSRAIEFLRKKIKKGDPWKKAVADLTIADQAFKAVILDDFLKITLAERHFQGKEEIKSIARLLQVPVELLEAVKEAMIREVRDASIEVYRRSRSEQTH